MHVHTDDDHTLAASAVSVETLALGLERGGDGEYVAVVVAVEVGEDYWLAYRTSSDDARDMARALLEKAALLDQAQFRRENVKL